MKNLFVAFFFSISVFASPIQDRKLDTDALRELATEFGMSHEEDLVDATQRLWLRKPGTERWEMDEIPNDKRVFVLNWAKDQGIFEAWRPLWPRYDQALILGATTSRMQMRLNYLKELWEQGFRFNLVVWLTGDRPLDNRVDSLTDCCKTESEAARKLWEEAILPQEMRQVPVVFIAAPMKKQGRPNTQDTILTWLQKNPTPGSTLFVSNQPFCGYQYAVLNTYLPESIQFDVVGPADNLDSNPGEAMIILDSLARWLYQESMTFKN